jgi:hypothetical protein
MRAAVALELTPKPVRPLGVPVARLDDHHVPAGRARGRSGHTHARGDCKRRGEVLAQCSVARNERTDVPG